METNVSNLGAEMKLSSIYQFCIITIILTSCGTPPTTQIPGSSFQSSQIKEPQIGAPYTEITIQEIRASNCDGTNPTTTVSRSLVQEQTTFFEVAVEAGGLIRGTPIPTVLEAELEAKIKTALGSNLGNKFEQTISTVLETQSGQAWKHKIYWNETKVKGIIDVVYQNGTATLNFEKMIAIELFDRTGESLICDGNGASISPTPSSSQEVPIATLETEPPIIQPTPVPNQPSYAEILCPYAITQSDVNSFNKGVADVPTVRTYINQFDAGRPNDGGAFTKGTKIPAGVVIATNFDEVNASAWSQYPVIPLVHSGSWGLFQSTAEYIAPNAGACRVIVP